VLALKLSGTPVGYCHNFTGDRCFPLAALECTVQQADMASGLSYGYLFCLSVCTISCTYRQARVYVGLAALLPLCSETSGRAPSWLQPLVNRTG
jgi:hypothetical protein